jgi:hypothetical protein
VVDVHLAERVEEPLRELRGVALAVLGGEAVPRVARAVGDVQVADVAEADDTLSRCVDLGPATVRPERVATPGALAG